MKTEWKVNGLHFDRLDLAMAYAQQTANTQQRTVHVMEKLDSMTPAYITWTATEEDTCGTPAAVERLS